QLLEIDGCVAGGGEDRHADGVGGGERRPADGDEVEAGHAAIGVAGADGRPRVVERDGGRGVGHDGVRGDLRAGGVEEVDRGTLDPVGDGVGEGHHRAADCGDGAGAGGGDRREVRGDTVAVVEHELVVELRSARVDAAQIDGAGPAGTRRVVGVQLACGGDLRLVEAQGAVVD